MLKRLSLFLLLAALSVSAADSEWLTDYAKAQAEAKKSQKTILLDFTGSDWCGPCMQMKKAVFSDKEFLKYAGTSLVLVEVDFPQDKPQSVDQRRTNQELSELFKVEGYPTILLVNAEGKEVYRQVGYNGEKPAEFIAKLKKALKKK